MYFMPIGILIIMSKSKSSFSTAGNLAHKIDMYFSYIDGEYHLDKKQAPGKPAQKIWDREPEPATIAGLALFLGFNSVHAFDEYIENGRFANTLKRGRLRIEAAYEKKLHQQSSAGAIFALKNMGRDDKKEEAIGSNAIGSLKVEISISGPQLAANEQEVTL